MNKQLINKVVAIGFCCTLAMFSTVNALKPMVAFSENENRQLQELPKPSVRTIVSGKFGKDFDTYTSDQFLMRWMFVSAKAEVERALQKTQNNGTYFGKNQYFIQVPQEVNETYVRNNIKAVADLAQAGDYNVNLLLAPTAFEVMQENLPMFAYEDTQIKLLDRVEKELAQSKAGFINPLAAINENHGRQVYYRTDHHWTTYGAYKAYTALGEKMAFSPFLEDAFEVKTLTEEFLGTLWSKATLANFPPDTIEAFIPKKEMTYTMEFLGEGGTMDGLYSMDKLETKDKYSVFLDGNHSFVKINSSMKNGKTLFVIKDSYAHSLVPFLANHYETIYLLDMRYFNGNTKDLIDQYGAKEILFVYNCENFATDNNLVKISANIKK